MEKIFYYSKIKKTDAFYIDTRLVYPLTRYSDRVIFGTGPFLIKGQTGDWSTYPFYHYESFNDLQIVFQKLNELFYHNIPTPIDEYIIEIFNTTAHDFWQNLRKTIRI